jgi:hypothetical protein
VADLAPASKSRLTWAKRNGGRVGYVVAFVAVSLSGIDGSWANTAQSVLFVCNRFKVFWIQTSTIATEMVEFQALGNGTDEKHVSDPMGVNVLKNRIPTKTIAFLGNRFCPYPAFALNANPWAHFFGEPIQHVGLPTFDKSMTVLGLDCTCDYLVPCPTRLGAK